VIIFAITILMVRDGEISLEKDAVPHYKSPIMIE